MIQIKVDATTWQEKALCVGADPEWWFPAHNGPRVRLSTPMARTSQAGQDNLKALRICESCPVKHECAQFARDTNQKWGIWGGEYPIDRGHDTEETIVQ